MTATTPMPVYTPVWLTALLSVAIFVGAIASGFTSGTLFLALTNDANLDAAFFHRFIIFLLLALLFWGMSSFLLIRKVASKEFIICCILLNIVVAIATAIITALVVWPAILKGGTIFCCTASKEFYGCNRVSKAPLKLLSC